MPSHSTLQVPAQVLEATSVTELLRVWGADGKQIIALRADAWSDPAVWGICLAELARHVARAFEVTGKMPSSEALGRIRAGLDAEWAFPTDSTRGDVGR